MGRRSFGGSGPPVRVSGPFSFSSPPLPCSAPPSDLFPQFHPGVGSCCCGSRPAGEGNHRTGSLFPRLLQPSFCDTKGHWWVAPGDRPLAPQPVGGCLAFSYGDCPVGSPVSLSLGLDGVLGTQGRLPSGSGSSIFTSVPEVLRGG